MSRSTRDQLHPTVLSSRNGAGVRLLEPDAPRKRWIAGDLALRVRVFGESQPEGKVDLLRWYDLPSLNGRVRSIVLHPEGTHAFCAVGRHVCCVDLSSLSVVWRASGPRVWGFIRSSPFALGLTSEGSLLASYDSGHLQWIDPEGKVRSLAYENDAPLRFVMLPGGRQFLGTDGRKVGVWDIDLRVRIAGFEPDDVVTALAVSPASNTAFIRTLRSVSAWSLADLSPIAAFPVGPSLPILAVSADGGRVVTGESKGVTVRSVNGEIEALLFVPGARILSAQFEPWTGAVVTGSDDGVVRHWDLARRTEP